VSHWHSACISFLEKYLFIFIHVLYLSCNQVVCLFVVEY
jgi:hypothetical protein